MNADTELILRHKAALLLVALGKVYSSQILKYLQEDEIERLTLAIANVRRVSPEVKQQILDEFYELCLARNYISEGGIEYAKEILNKAIGAQRADELIHKLTSSLKVRPFDFVRRADPNQLVNFIQNEHPQTIALIFSYLDPKQAANVLASLPQDRQIEVVARIAKMGRTSPEYIKEIERILEKKLSSMDMTEHMMVGGVDSTVAILNSVDRGTEKYILESLGSRNQELADEIKRKMFVFEDIIKLSRISIQRVLRDVDNHDLTIALKGANEDVSKVIFANMSQRMQETIKEDLALLGPVRVRDVEEAQQKVVSLIRKLEEDGEIVIARDREDGLIA